MDIYSKEQDYDEAATSAVGKSIISERFPSTMDSFWFMVEYNAVINPFDFVSVDNINNFTSIGIIKDIQSVVINETLLHFDAMKYKSNDYYGNDYESNNTRGNLLSSAKQASVVVTVAKVAVVANIEENLKDKKPHESFLRSLNMPIQTGKAVKYATPAQISFALGIPRMERPIPAGIIEMSPSSCVVRCFIYCRPRHSTCQRVGDFGQSKNNLSPILFTIIVPDTVEKTQGESSYNYF